MSTIRITYRGDYSDSDPNTQDIKFKGIGLELSHYRSSYIASSSSTAEYLFGSRSTDGVYADFSDNTKGALMHGGARGDVLIGGSGSDHILGAAGNDTITGGAGGDHVSGGQGADIFEFRHVGDFGTVHGPGHLDRIADFSGSAPDGQGDRIDLSNIADFTLVDRFDHGGLAEVRAVDHDGRTVVYGDRDGDGTVDFRFVVHTDAPLTQADFVAATGQPASHPIDAAFHGEPIGGAHPAFAEALHAVEHLAIA